jgi:hypothetical protein
VEAFREQAAADHARKVRGQARRRAPARDGEDENPEAAVGDDAEDHAMEVEAEVEVDGAESSDDSASEGRGASAKRGSDEDIPLPRFLARRCYTKSKWARIMGEMNTTDIVNGSFFEQKEDDSVPMEVEGADPDDPVFEKFLVRWDGMSYLHVSWESRQDLIANIGRTAKVRSPRPWFCVSPPNKCASLSFRQGSIKRFVEKDDRGEVEVNEYNPDEYFDPAFLEIDRVLDIEEDPEGGTQFLVKVRMVAVRERRSLAPDAPSVPALSSRTCPTQSPPTRSRRTFRARTWRSTWRPTTAVR